MPRQKLTGEITPALPGDTRVVFDALAGRVEMASSGKHYDVKADPLSLRRLIAWVDANCPYAGDEELQAMDDLDFPGIDELPSVGISIACADVDVQRAVTERLKGNDR